VCRPNGSMARGRRCSSARRLGPEPRRRRRTEFAQRGDHRLRRSSGRCNPARDFAEIACYSGVCFGAVLTGSGDRPGLRQGATEALSDICVAADNISCLLIIRGHSPSNSAAARWRLTSPASAPAGRGEQPGLSLPAPSPRCAERSPQSHFLNSQPVSQSSSRPPKERASDLTAISFVSLIAFR
jgi:hypothetical protein